VFLIYWTQAYNSRSSKYIVENCKSRSSYSSSVLAWSMLCHAQKKPSQASVVLNLGLQCFCTFLLACQAHNKAEDSGKTWVIAFLRAWSQSVLIAPGPTIIVGVFNWRYSSLFRNRAHLYDSLVWSGRKANDIKKLLLLLSMPINIY